MSRIYVTDADHKRLKSLIENATMKDPAAKEYLERLDDELEAAEIREQKDIPNDVITMNSKVRLKDLNSNEELIYTLVYPGHANIELGRISILAPIGTAMIGYRVGEEIEWQVPAGVRRLKVEEVIYQPEASGDFER